MKTTLQALALSIPLLPLFVTRFRSASLAAAASAILTSTALATPGPDVRYGTEVVDGVEIFYREAGKVGDPQLVLLHGFPTSSHMFRNLIDDLAADFHILAPDYPGFGLSAAPSPSEFEYSFANIASVVDRVLAARGFDDYTLYLMDYGAPIGYRIALAHPERVAGLVIQNGNAYDEGLSDFWDPIKAYWRSGAAADAEPLREFLKLDATKWQYQHGTRNPDSISPDNWLADQPLLDRPGNADIQVALFYDYRTNVAEYPRWQRWLREAQPPTLLAWGKNDEIFPTEGALPYLNDLPDAELHLLDTGHFALEEDGDRIAALIRSFHRSRIAADGTH